MRTCLVHRNARSMPWVSKEALDLRRTSKPSSPSKEPDNRVLRGYCGAKESGNLGPFHIKPKAHAKEEEISEDKRRRSKLPGDVVEDNPVLGKLRSRKEKAAHHQR